MEVIVSIESKEDDEKKDKDKDKGYDDIIMDEVIMDEGFFIIYKVEDKYYFEILMELFSKEILVVSWIFGYVKGFNFGGVGMKFCL